MSDIIESIKQGASQVLSSLDQEGHLKSTLEGLKSQWSEVERRRRVNQLNSELRALQGEARQLTEALGLQVLSLHDAGKIDHPELARVCERLNELRSDVEGKRAELGDLQAREAPPATRCAQCQTMVASDAEFCPKCGARVKEQQPASTPSTPAKAVVRLRCPKCKTMLPEGAGFCPTCGVKLKMPETAPAPQRFCPSCGAEMSPTSRFCPACGHAAAKP
jgi:RNA polymerase subunit RPABC4/transcription elongation factor Spt4